jgi:tetratricopeptide (TPR) repeat protein
VDEVEAILAAGGAEAREKIEALLAARRSSFGLSDPRYARALEASAELFYAAGEHARAVDRASEAAGIYFQNKHDRFADAIALEAELLAAAELGARPFAEIAEVPERVIEAIAHAALERSRRAPAELAMELLRALYALLLERAGESHPASVRVLAGLANTAQELGDWEMRRTVLDALVASFECINALPQAVEALIQRAAAERELGLPEDAEKTIAEAIARAKELGLDELVQRASKA